MEKGEVGCAIMPQGTSPFSPLPSPFLNPSPLSILPSPFSSILPSPFPNPSV
ncbi:hypothetical protein [Bacteroides sp.]